MNLQEILDKLNGYDECIVRLNPRWVEAVIELKAANIAFEEYIESLKDMCFPIKLFTIDDNGHYFALCDEDYRICLDRNGCDTWKIILADKCFANIPVFLEAIDQNSDIYCFCNSPNVVRNSVGGKSFLFCKSCKKERK